MSDKTKTSLEAVVQTGIETALKEVHTCLPGLVTRVDHINQLIDVQPTIKRKFIDGAVNLPLLTDVPVRFLRSKSYAFTFPIEVDQEVMLFFAERSIDTWLTQGGIQDSKDVRRHSLSDAFAVPVMYSQTDVIPNFDSSNLVLKKLDDSSFIKITPGGDVILNGDTDFVTSFTDMKIAFDQAITELNNLITVYNGHGHTGISIPPTEQATPSSADMSGAKVDTVKVP